MNLTSSHPLKKKKKNSSYFFSHFLISMSISSSSSYFFKIFFLLIFRQTKLYLDFFFISFFISLSLSLSLSLSHVWSNLVHKTHLGLFGPIQLFRSTLVCLVHFISLRSNTVYQFKNNKIQVQVESIINYLNNISCSHMIIFGYHNNFLKKMRI